MNLLWKDIYLIGVDSVDNQHKELFSFAEKLMSERQHPELFCSKQVITEYIDFLKRYAAKHFANEEKYMRAIGYTGYKKHRDLHKLLEKDVLRYEKELIEQDFSLSVVRKLWGFVASWVVYHVVYEDQLIPKVASPPDFKSAYSSDINLFIQEFATDVKRIIRSSLRISGVSAFLKSESYIYVSSDICLRVGSFLQGRTKRTVYFVFSKETSLRLFRAITDTEFGEVNETVLRAVIKLSENVNSKLIESLQPDKIVYNTEAPSRIPVDAILTTSERYIIPTKLGSMTIILH